MTTIQTNNNHKFDQKLIKAAECLDRVEQAFNIAGSIPVVALASGIARAAFGSAEIVASLGLGALFSVAAALTKNQKSSAHLRDLASFSFKLLGQGGLNIYRGLLAEAFTTGILFIGVFPMLFANCGSPNGPFMPYVSNKESVEETINERDWVAPTLLGPLQDAFDNYYVEMREQLRW